MTRPDPITVLVEVDHPEPVQALRLLASVMRAIAEKADEVDSLAGALDSDDDVDLDESEASS